LFLLEEAFYFLNADLARFENGLDGLSYEQVSFLGDAGLAWMLSGNLFRLLKSVKGDWGSQRYADSFLDCFVNSAIQSLIEVEIQFFCYSKFGFSSPDFSSLSFFEYVISLRDKEKIWVQIIFSLRNIFHGIWNHLLNFFFSHSNGATQLLHAPLG
jgi:hypothetical protein